MPAHKIKNEYEQTAQKKSLKLVTLTIDKSTHKM